MRFQSSALFIVLVLGCLCCLCLYADANEQEQQQQQQNPSSARSSLAPPKLFDFGRFKSMFKKKYGSLMEELSRKKIFLARAFHAFLSFISYKHYKQSYYARVNELSDWTDDELRSLDMPRAKVEIDFEDSANNPAVEIEEIEEKLKEIVENKEPGYDKIAAELLGSRKTAVVNRKKREASLNRSSLRLDYFLDAIEPEQVSDLTVHHVPSNNKAYEPPELSSYGAESEKDTLSPVSEVQLRIISGLKGAGLIGSLVSSVASKLVGNSGAEEKKNSVPDEVFVDHRDSGCFTPVKSQNRCGSCFIFSSTALYEYKHCKETGKLISFSEQYPIDCGGRMGINGCGGGQEMDVSQFYHKYGIELDANYPYRHRQDSCPYSSDTKPSKMGYLRVNEPQFKIIFHFQFEDYIKRLPIILGFGVSKDFHSYGGGVDKGETCDQTRGHSMLVVGSGREDGEEYWLLRNSYGPSWGEQGYYKISKKAKNCFLDQGMGWVLDPDLGMTVFGDVNKLNDGEAVKRLHRSRVTNFLKDMLSKFTDTQPSDPNMVTPASA